MSASVIVAAFAVVSAIVLAGVVLRLKDELEEARNRNNSLTDAYQDLLWRNDLAKEEIERLEALLIVKPKQSPAKDWSVN